MTKLRWLAVAIGLAGVFCLSIAAGAYVGRLRASPSNPSVAITGPTPSATVSPAASPASPPTLPPTSPASSAPTTPTPSPAPTALDTPPPDTLSAKGFAQELAAAIRESDDEYLFKHLHPATIERYGEQACRDQVAPIAGDPGWEILGSNGPAPWSYETDGIATTIDDAWAVSIRQRGATPELRDLHFAQAGGTWRWFTDCGTPASEETR